jgi:hypothetical protein
MPDYELERLNTRSFEQLTQALAIRILGSQVVIFGDGPDGGREATFEGKVSHQTRHEPWNGFGILQAKFKQRPHADAKKNADWLLDQLRQEFKKFTPRKKKSEKNSKLAKRPCPQYYVIATNISLSAVKEKGGKDRVTAYLERLRTSHGLTDYAIWDGDQICRYLDGYPEIRTTYQAWLLPGDVLAVLMEQLKTDRADFLSTMTRYLEAELLDDQFARLSQGGYTDAKHIPLSSVFIDLPVQPQDTNEPHRQVRRRRKGGQPNQSEDDDGTASTFLRLLFDEGRQVLRPSFQQTKSSSRRAGARETSGRIVLIGGPGQGKTTIGQYACQLYRAALLNSANRVYSPEVRQALSKIDEWASDSPSVGARRYPLRVDLKQFATSLASRKSDRSRSLFDYILKRIEARTSTTTR